MILVYQEKVYGDEFRSGLEAMLNSGWELVQPPAFFTQYNDQQGFAVVRRVEGPSCAEKFCGGCDCMGDDE